MTTPNENAIAKAIKATLISPNEADRNFEAANVVDGLFALARAIDGATKWLGTGDGQQTFGGMEFLGKCMLESSEKIAKALSEVAQAIREQKGQEP